MIIPDAAAIILRRKNYDTEKFTRKVSSIRLASIVPPFLGQIEHATPCMSTSLLRKPDPLFKRFAFTYNTRWPLRLSSLFVVPTWCTFSTSSSSSSLPVSSIVCYSASVSVYKRRLPATTYRSQLPTIYHDHLVLATNFACSTNHNVEQPVSRFHSQTTYGHENRAFRERVASWRRP